MTRLLLYFPRHEGNLAPQNDRRYHKENALITKRRYTSVYFNRIKLTVGQIARWTTIMLIKRKQLKLRMNTSPEIISQWWHCVSVCTMVHILHTALIQESPQRHSSNQSHERAWYTLGNGVEHMTSLKGVVAPLRGVTALLRGVVALPNGVEAPLRMPLLFSPSTLAIVFGLGPRDSHRQLEELLALVTTVVGVVLVLPLVPLDDEFTAELLLLLLLLPPAATELPITPASTKCTNAVSNELSEESEPESRACNCVSLVFKRKT